MLHATPFDKSPPAVTGPEPASPSGSGSELQYRELDDQETAFLRRYTNDEPWLQPVLQHLRDDIDPLGPARGVFSALLFTLITGGGIGLLWMLARVIWKALGL